VRIGTTATTTIGDMASATEPATSASGEWRPRHGLCVLRRELLLCFRESLAVERAAAAVKKADGEQHATNDGDVVASNHSGHSHGGVACNGHNDEGHGGEDESAATVGEEGVDGHNSLAADAEESSSHSDNVDDGFRFNLDAYTNVELADEPDKIKSDKALVKAAGARVATLHSAHSSSAALFICLFYCCFLPLS
jgi:hypothetical protein